jgi:hypothetical protein
MAEQLAEQGQKKTAMNKTLAAEDSLKSIASLNSILQTIEQNNPNAEKEMALWQKINSLKMLLQHSTTIYIESSLNKEIAAEMQAKGCNCATAKEKAAADYIITIETKLSHCNETKDNHAFCWANATATVNDQKLKKIMNVKIPEAKGGWTNGNKERAAEEAFKKLTKSIAENLTQAINQTSEPSATATVANSQSKLKVAVYMAGKNQMNDHSDIAAFALTDALSASKNFTATERTEDFLNEIKKESVYQHSGDVDNSQIAEIAMKSGASYVCVSELIKFSKEYLLTARLIKVDSSIIISSSYKIFKENEILSKSQELAKDLINNFESRLETKKRKKKERVAIYLAGNGNDDLNRALQSLITHAVSKSDKYIVAERTNAFLEKLLQELEYQHSGRINEQELAKLGTQLGAKNIIAIKIASQKTVNIRMINVESGDILNSQTETLDVSSARDFEISVANFIAKFLKTDASSIFPEAKNVNAKIGIRMGLGFYKYSDDYNSYGIGNGYSAGFALRVSLASQLSFNSGLDFYYRELFNWEEEKGRMSEYAVSVPVWLQLVPSKGDSLYLATGVQVDFPFNSKLAYEGKSYSYSRSSRDIGFIFGLGYIVANRVEIDFKGIMNLTDVFDFSVLASSVHVVKAFFCFCGIF